LLKQWQFMLLTALAVAALALVIANIVLFTGNREAQNEFSTRAQYIQQSQQIEPLYQGIIRNLAEISAKTNDPQITQLLTSQGITFSVNPQAPANANTPQADAKGKGK
jgi:type VI protein secretion system component VasK